MQEKRQITANHNWLILYTGDHGDKELQLTDNADRVEISVHVRCTFIGKQLTPKEAYEVSAWLHEWANEHGYPGDHSDTCDRITELHSEYSADIAAMQLRAEAAEAVLAAVPVEAIYYVWLAAVAHSCANGNYASKDVIAVDIWLAAQHVKPWEVQPCPKCKGTGYRYNIYGEMAECMDCGARGEAQP